MDGWWKMGMNQKRVCLAKTSEKTPYHALQAVKNNPHFKARKNTSRTHTHTRGSIRGLIGYYNLASICFTHHSDADCVESSKHKHRTGSTLSAPASHYYSYYYCNLRG